MTPRFGFWAVTGACAAIAGWLLPTGAWPGAPLGLATRALTSAPAARAAVWSSVLVENHGQVAEGVRYYVPGGGPRFTAHGVVFAGIEPAADAEAAACDAPAPRGRQPWPPLTPAGRRTVVYALEFVDARPVAPRSGDPLPGRVHYVTGVDPAAWHTDLPTFRSIVYPGLYGPAAGGAAGDPPQHSGTVDLTFRLDTDRLKYEILLHPGADPGWIRFAYVGVEGATVDRDGRLAVATAAGTVRDDAPAAYQIIGSARVPVEARFVLESPAGAGGAAAEGRVTYGFAVGAYDTRYPLVIDPGLEYSTFLGGTSGYTDRAEDVAVDAMGHAYVTGTTHSADFPTTPGAFDRSFNNAVAPGQLDAFVVKLDPTGSDLVYATFLGGEYADSAYAITVDDQGQAYVTGSTASGNFPTTAGAFDVTFDGVVGADRNVFVTKLDAAGAALVYSTFLGGDAPADIGNAGKAIAVDDAGSAYVTGFTAAETFPTTPGAFDTGYNGHVRYAGDAFVTKLAPDGGSLVYSTFLGGTWDDAGEGIAVDGTGHAYVAGWTASEGFPVTAGAFDTTFTVTGRIDSDDAFVAKLAPDGAALVWSTFLGERGDDEALAIAVNPAGEAHVAGTTGSLLFPVTPGAFDESYSGSYDAFVTKLSANGASLLYSTVLGGTEFDECMDLALDAAGDVSITGWTWSPEFPVTPGAFQTVKRTYSDVFVTKIRPGGLGSADLRYSTFLGGAESDERAEGIAADAAGALYVAGWTYSGDFPITPEAFQTTLTGEACFVAKVVPTALTGEQCQNGRDDDADGRADCADVECCLEAACAGSAACPVLMENLTVQPATLDAGTIGGAHTGTFRFANLELVTIATGPFAGQGFARGDWEAVLGGTPYTGTWRGVLSFRPAEAAIAIDGATMGDLVGVLQARLEESAAGSGVFDRYQATWDVVRAQGAVAADALELAGSVAYGTVTLLSGVTLAFSQTNPMTTLSGDHSGSLHLVATRLAIASAGSPYFGEGFVMLSYVSDGVAGSGWATTRRVAPGEWDLTGFFGPPLYGVVTGTADETGPSPALALTLARAGLPPLADVELRVAPSPGFASPGTTRDYLVEYRNDGLVAAEETIVVLELPGWARYVSATGGGLYRWDTHEVIWKLGTVPPRGRGVLSAKVTFLWGLPEGMLQYVLAMYETTTPEKDDYLRPGRERFFDHAAYRAYEPVEARASTVLDAAAFAGERAADPGLEAVYQHALAGGHAFRIAGKTTLSDGSVVTQAILVNDRSEMVALTRVNDRTLLRQFSGDVFLLSDDQGGLRWNLATDALTAWGAWDVPGSPTTGQCIRNCVIHEVPFSVLKKVSSTYKLIAKSWGCLKCVVGKGESACVKCIIDLNGNIPVIGDLIKVRDCFTCCQKDPTCHKCQADKVECGIWEPSLGHYSGVHTWRCDVASGEYAPFAETVNCGAVPVNCCIGDVLVFGGCGKVPRICRDGRCLDPTSPTACGRQSSCETAPAAICPAKDPNAKHGPAGAVAAGERLDYRIEFENVGQGEAYGVYVTDILDEDLDAATLAIGPVVYGDGGTVGAAGEYEPATRTVSWFVGPLGPHAGGYATLAAEVRADAPRGTEIVNAATVYFPSVPEVTPTNPVVSVIPLEDCANGLDDDGDGYADCDAPACDGLCPEADRCGDSRDNDGDGLTDCLDPDCPACPEVCDNGVDDEGDGFADCADYECCGDPACPACGAATRYSKGTSQVQVTRKGDTTIALRQCVGEEVCALLREGGHDLALRLEDCAPLSVPAARVTANRKRTLFKARSARGEVPAYSLQVDCGKRVLTARLRAGMIACLVDRCPAAPAATCPVTSCFAAGNGPCDCAEDGFTIGKDRRGRTVRLKMKAALPCVSK